MRTNRHDTWQAFCEQYRELLADTGMPASVTRSEQRFRDLLESGRVATSQGELSLEEVSSIEWRSLYQFAAIFFREFASFAPENLFPAFRDEIQRRGDKFPR